MDQEKTKQVESIEVLDKIRAEHEESWNAIRDTIVRKQDDLKLYHDYNGNDLRSNLIYGATQQLLSLYKDDELSIEFDGNYLIEDVISNLNTSSKGDYDDMGMQQIDLQADQDMLLLGVGILIDTGFDTIGIKPTPKAFDPLTWRPDPYIFNNEQDARYHGFEMSMSIAEVEEDDSLSDEFKKYIKDTKIQDIEKTNRDRGNSIGQVETSQLLQSQVTLYYHYHNHDDTKYLTVCDPSFTIIGKHEKVKQTKEDDKNGVSYFPISIRWFSPKRGMPFGISLIDLLRQPQKAKDFFLNLKRYKAAKEAMGGDIIVDIDSGINPLSFKEQNNLSPRIHGVSLAGKPIDQIIHNVEQSKPTTQLIDSTMQDIEQQAFITSGVSSQSMGVPSDKNMTAKESQTVQMNSNIRLSLGQTYRMQAIKRFWDIIWYRSLVINFASADKKTTLVNNGLYGADNIFSRSDLITSIKPKIEIVSKAMKDQLYQKLLLAFEVMYQTSLQNPNISPFAKRMIEKRIWRLKGATKEECEIFTIPADPNIISDEMNAREHVILINAGDVPQMYAEQDHTMYLTMYQRCEEGTTKAKAIAKRKDMIRMTVPKQQQQVTGGGMSAAAGNIAMNQMNQQNTLQSNPQ